MKKYPVSTLLLLVCAALTLSSQPVFSQDNKPAQAAPEPPPLPKYPDPDELLAAMKKAAAYFRSNLSMAGGYATSWPRDLSESITENHQGPALISIQPPGTPHVGLAMLEAHLETGDALFLQGAREAADALAWCQLASGGWTAEFSFELQQARRYHYRRDIEAGDVEPGNRSARSSLDDNKTQSAIRFLLEFANSDAGKSAPDVRQTLNFALDGLLAAQAPNGSWPQHFSGPAAADLAVIPASFPAEWSRTFPKVDYTGHYTLNDNNLLIVMHLLLKAYQLESDNNQRFLDAARRLGDFLLLAQLPEPQRVWAQQYDFDMHPTWARKFEPPAACSVESFGAMEALYEIWLATSDDRYIATLPEALEWFKKNQIKEGEWARFYELQTNRPLYCEADTYLVTYDDSNLPTHYGFKVSGGFGRGITRFEEQLTHKRDEVLAKRERSLPDSEKEWSDRARKLAPGARDALKLQKKEGYWVSGDFIGAGEFVKHMRSMTTYREAADKGGETFSAIREKEIEKEKQQQREREAAAAQAAEKN